MFRPPILSASLIIRRAELRNAPGPFPVPGLPSDWNQDRCSCSQSGTESHPVSTSVSQAPIEPSQRKRKYPTKRGHAKPYRVAARGDTQHTAHHGDQIAGPLRLHECEDPDGIESVSRANQSAALAKISRSKRSRRFSRRSLPAVLNLGVLSADSGFGGLGACGRSPERADRFESTPCQADRRPSRRSAMADLACGRASRRVPDSFYRRRPRDRRVLPQAPRPRARFPGS